MKQQAFCEAIRDRKTVDIRYDKDALPRTFAPHILYRATTGHITVANEQTHNPAKPWYGREWRNFSLEKVVAVAITEQSFVVDPSFDPHDARYGSGIVCHVRKHA